ncbi:MAG: hypothetical protein QM800_10265 [Paludibacter sp.]
MKKTFITSLILCAMGATSGSLSAQEYKTFDLSKYYTPDIVRSKLDFSGSGSGVANSSENAYSNNINDHYFNGSLNSSFSNIVNTRSLIRSLNASVLFSGNSGSSLDNANTNYESGVFSNNVGIGAFYQLYNTKKQFISFGGSGSFAFRTSKNTKTDSLAKYDFYKDNNFWGSIYINIGAGIGRIENVTDAQQTIYLLNAFAKNKILTKDLSENEIFQLAQCISQVKNKRFLNARLHMIYEISQVDSFFVKNNLISKQDARYFTTLYDIWLYGDKFERRAGQKIELSLTPLFSKSYGYSKSHNYIPATIFSTSESFSNGGNANYQLMLSYEYEKPFLQKWQHSVYASLDGNYANYNGTTRNKPTDIYNSSTSSTKHVNLNAEYTLGFYPDTRTNLYAKVNEETSCLLSYSKTTNNITERSDKKNLSNLLAFELGTYYYFSPQLRLTASATIQNRHYIEDITNSSKASNQFNSNFSIGCTYSLF